MIDFLRFTLLSVALAAPGYGDGVVEPEAGWRDRVTEITDRGVVEQSTSAPDQFLSHIQATLPPDDRGLWYIEVFCHQTAGDSQLLLRDLRESPALRCLANWGILKVVDYSTEANRARWKHFGVRYTPTILVYPHPGHPRLENKYALAQEGYGGDGDMLARNIFAAIRRIYKAQGISDCPGPYCPNPNQPYQPNQPNQPYRPNQPDDWPPPAPVPDNLDGGGGGFHINLSGEWLAGALWTVVKWIVIVAVIWVIVRKMVNYEGT